MELAIMATGAVIIALVVNKLLTMVRRWRRTIKTMGPKIRAFRNGMITLAVIEIVAAAGYYLIMKGL